MSSTTPPDEGYPKKVKRPGATGSFRITPPEPVRDEVGLRDEEPWAWFWDARADQFYLRRATEGLAGIPDTFTPVGVVRARSNGRYLDFAIPHVGADLGEVVKSQMWTWFVEDHNTLRLVRS